MLAAGCGGKSAVDYHREAQQALDAGDADRAMQLVAEGLPVAGDDRAVIWRLEQVRLEAMAKKGQGAEIVAELERLGGAYGPQITPALYRSLADKAGPAGGAVPILDAGLKKFPAEAAGFEEAIAKIQEGGDPAAMEQLRALGYIQ
jgi:hypothetical protein